MMINQFRIFFKVGMHLYIYMNCNTHMSMLVFKQKKKTDLL